MDFDIIEKLNDKEINDLYTDKIYDFLAGNVYYVRCDGSTRNGAFHDVNFSAHPIGYCFYGYDSTANPCPVGDKAICHICGSGKVGKSCCTSKIQ